MDRVAATIGPVTSAAELFRAIATCCDAPVYELEPELERFRCTGCGLRVPLEVIDAVSEAISGSEAAEA